MYEPEDADISSSPFKEEPDDETAIPLFMKQCKEILKKKVEEEKKRVGEKK